MSWKETDVLQLWKNSTIVPVQERHEPKDFDLHKTNSAVHGTRSKLWNSLTEMPAEERKNYLSNLVTGWPYAWERRATLLPLHGSVVTAAMCNIFCTAKINGDIFFNNRKMKVLESIRSCPKSPVFLGAYTSGITALVLNQYLIFKPVLEREEAPCSSCVLTKSVMVSVLSGVLFPVVATPYLCYHAYAIRNPKAPGVGHNVDLITLSYEFSRSVWRYIPRLIATQMVVGTAVAFSLLWGRNRIFETAVIDADFAKECVEKRMLEKENSWYNRFKRNLNAS